MQLACKFALPAGTPPDGGWPGLILFPAFPGTPARRNVLRHCRLRDGLVLRTGPVVVRRLVRPRGPLDAQDAQAIFGWLAARPEVSDTQIGAYGMDLGGAEVWNAAVAGLPFKAIVAGDTWSNLGQALKPTGVLNASLFQLLSAEARRPGTPRPGSRLAPTARVSTRSPSRR